MAHWDVFHSDRLEAERSLTTEAVRQALARGEIVEDDLIRPAGSSRWARIGDSPEFESLAIPAAPPPFEPPSFDSISDDADESDLTGFEVDPDSYASIERAALARAEAEPNTLFDPPPAPEPEPEPELEPEPEPESEAEPQSLDAILLPDEETEAPDLPELDGPEADAFEPEEFDPQDEDEEAAEFTLSRNSADRVEELDLAAMVDVAFQLVLFFLVTASTVVFKTLEVPRPNDDKPPEAAAQGRSRSIEELKDDFILVEVDAAGNLKVDRQPIPADRATLAERLRAARQATGRKAMLLSADFATRHENAVLAFDVANEVDLAIAIAQPAPSPAGKK